MCSLRGSVCLYQGEELGLGEADVPFKALRDPYGIAFWPNFKGRDGCRTPMPWTGGAHAGFSSAVPWLPVDPAQAARSVAAQEADAGSVLHAVRAFLQWRKTRPALTQGTIGFLDAPEPVLAFVRETADERMLAVFNLSPDAAIWTVPGDLSPRLLEAPGPARATLQGRTLSLPAYGAAFAGI